MRNSDPGTRSGDKGMAQGSTKRLVRLNERTRSGSGPCSECASHSDVTEQSRAAITVTSISFAVTKIVVRDPSRLNNPHLRLRALVTSLVDLFNIRRIELDMGGGTANDRSRPLLAELEGIAKAHGTQLELTNIARDAIASQSSREIGGHYDCQGIW